MKYRNVLITVVLVFATTELYSQSSNDYEKAQVLKVFELFFNSMRNRDTVALKTCIDSHSPGSWFLKLYQGNDERFGGMTASTEKGFLKSVSVSDSPTGKFKNEFDSINVRINQRYAVVTAYYKCFIQDSVNSKGMITLQMTRRDKWRIESVTRYSDTGE